jgi:hypothetical protein
MRCVSHKSCTEKQNTHFMFSNFFPENCAIYEIMWKHMVEPDRPQMTIWCMRFTCWIIKATDKHSEYIILIASPQQQWLCKHVIMLHYIYIACLAGIWTLRIETMASSSFMFMGIVQTTEAFTKQAEAYLNGL